MFPIGINQIQLRTKLAYCIFHQTAPTSLSYGQGLGKLIHINTELSRPFYSKIESLRRWSK